MIRGMGASPMHLESMGEAPMPLGNSNCTATASRQPRVIGQFRRPSATFPPMGCRYQFLMGVLKSILLRCAASAIVCVAMAGCDRGSSSQKPAATAPVPQAASAPTLPPAGIFEDATTRLGVSFTHQSGGTGHFMPRSIGPGAATFDYDGDGRLDLYLIQTGGPDSKAANQLFHQNEGGAFTNVTADSGLDLIGWGMGVAAGDVNNDGKVDLVVTEYGRVKLFLNASEGPKPLFTDITADA